MYILSETVRLPDIGVSNASTRPDMRRGIRRVNAACFIELRVVVVAELEPMHTILLNQSRPSFISRLTYLHARESRNVVSSKSGWN